MPIMSRLTESLIETAESKYRLTMVAAKRARQINDGSQPLVNSRSVKPTTLSLEELGAQKLEYSVVDDVSLVRKAQEK